MNELRLSTIAEQRRDCERFKVETFEKILRQLCKKINAVAEVGQLFCLYEVPTFVLGGVRYDMPDCVAYLERRLRENTYTTEVTFYVPNVLFVAWKLPS